MIPVTKPTLPDRAKLVEYIDGIYEREWLTNNGPLVQELTRRLEDYLGVDNLLLVTNGTLALQVAYKALGISGQAITSPFSFVATTSSLKWESIGPVFADIDPNTYCIDPASVEQAINDQTQAIVPVHVFGNGCDVESLKEIGQRHNVKIIYDGAHAFGVNYKGESLLQQGDATTLSFHATKLFHSIEGGAIIFKNKDDLERAKLLINFGIEGPTTITELGINAKMNEFQAAMGLCLLDEMGSSLSQRERIVQQYEEQLADHVQWQAWNPDCSRNHAYCPVALADEVETQAVKAALEEKGIKPRRYFYPSLDTLNYVQPQDPQPNSRDLASRNLCLPLYPELESEQVNEIAQTITNATAKPIA